MECNIVASGIFYPAVNGDDGTWRVGAYYNAQDGLRFGNYSSNPYNTFIRFPNVTIPQGSVITDAFVRFTSYQGLSATVCNVNVYFNDVDDAAAPVNEAGADGLALTGAVAWNALVAWIDGNIYDTGDISTILQTIVDRGGWSSGNAVQVLIKDNTSDDSAARAPSAFDYLSGAEKAELHVTWTESSSSSSRSSSSSSRSSSSSSSSSKSSSSSSKSSSSSSSSRSSSSSSSKSSSSSSKSSSSSSSSKSSSSSSRSSSSSSSRSSSSSSSSKSSSSSSSSKSSSSRSSSSSSRSSSSSSSSSRSSSSSSSSSRSSSSSSSSESSSSSSSSFYYNSEPEFYDSTDTIRKTSFLQIALTNKYTDEVELHLWANKDDDSGGVLENIKLTVACANGLFSGQNNSLGQECVTEKWVEVKSNGVVGSGIVDDANVSFKAIGGGFTNAIDYLSLGNMPTNTARKIFVKFNIPSDPEMTGTINPKFALQYDVKSSSSSSSRSSSSSSRSSSSSSSSSISESSSSRSSSSSSSSRSSSSSSSSSKSSSSSSSSRSSSSRSSSSSSSRSSSSSSRSSSSSSRSSSSSSKSSSSSSSSKSSSSSSSSSSSQSSSSSSSRSSSSSSSSSTMPDIWGAE